MAHNTTGGRSGIHQPKSQPKVGSKNLEKIKTKPGAGLMGKGKKNGPK